MILSILLYFVTFSVSCLACNRYERIIDRKKNVTFSKVMKNKSIKMDFRLLYIFFILAPPIFITTFRGIDVGSDTDTYLRIYNINKLYNLWDYVKIYGTYQHDIEIGYQQILRISFILKGGYNLVKCICGFLIVFFAWRGSVYYHKKYNVSSAICMMFFYLMEFSDGLNIARFSIALSIFYWSFQFVIEKKALKYIFCWFCMVLFHQVFIVAILFYLINLFSVDFFKKYGKFFLFSAIILFMLSLREIMNTLIPLFSVYIRKLGMYSFDTDVEYGIGVYLLSFMYLLPLIKWRRYVQNNEYWSYILFAVLTFLPLRFLGYFSPTLYRLGNMPEVLFLVLYSGIISIHKTTSKRWFWEMYVYGINILYYVYEMVILKYGHVYPFFFDFTNNI